MAKHNTLVSDLRCGTRTICWFSHMPLDGSSSKPFRVRQVPV